MTRKVLFFIFSVTLLSFGGLFVQINNSNPYTLDALGHWMFFINLTIFLTGFLTLISVRFLAPLNLKTVFDSCRKAAIFSLVVVILLYFNTQKILTLYSAIPIILSGFLLELFFRARKRNV